MALEGIYFKLQQLKAERCLSTHRKGECKMFMPPPPPPGGHSGGDVIKNEELFDRRNARAQVLK